MLHRSHSGAIARPACEHAQSTVIPQRKGPDRLREHGGTHVKGAAHVAGVAVLVGRPVADDAAPRHLFVKHAARAARTRAPI